MIGLDLAGVGGDRAVVMRFKGHGLDGAPRWERIGTMVGGGFRLRLPGKVLAYRLHSSPESGWIGVERARELIARYGRNDPWIRRYIIGERGTARAG